MDPIAREVDMLVDAVKARVPGLRERTPAEARHLRRAEPNKERLGGAADHRRPKKQTDKVRTEAARSGISVRHAEEGARRARHREAGRGEAHARAARHASRTWAATSRTRSSPDRERADWDILPDLVKKRAYAKAFLQAHRARALAALPPELRAGIAAEITEKIQAELAPADE
jgi:hypothetical protein